MKLQLRVEQKGGPGSGHFGHWGRPGKRGGSIPGGGAGYSPENLGKYRLSIRKRLEKTGASEELRQRVESGVKSTGKDFNEHDITMVKDFIVRNPDRAEYYAERYNIDLSDDILKRAAEHERFVDREVERKTWQLKDKYTFKSDSGRAVAIVMGGKDFDDVAYAGKVGKNIEDLSDALSKEFNVSLSVNSDVSKDIVHEEVSRIVNVARSNPVIARVLHDNVKSIKYETPPVGKTALATWNANDKSIRVYRTLDSFPMSATSFVHEIGHAFADSYARGLYATFGGGNHVSSYSWMNYDEDFAETFSAYITNNGVYRSWVPKKFSYIDSLVEGLQ